MTQQAYRSGNSAPAIAPLRTLAELGDEGTGRLAETDLTPRSPFPVNPGWYERYWYGDRSLSRWGLVAETLRSATARTMSGLVQGWRVT
jgi:hypothetical protein